jgi:hypothetical protein
LAKTNFPARDKFSQIPSTIAHGPQYLASPFSRNRIVAMLQNITPMNPLNATLSNACANDIVKISFVAYRDQVMRVSRAMQHQFQITEVRRID